MIRQEFLKKYAHLIVSTGINVQKGMCIQIATTVDDYDLAKLICIEAYKMGAKYINVVIDDQEVVKARLDSQDDEDISYLPAFNKMAQYVMATEKWASIRIANTSQHGVTKNVAPEKLTLSAKIASDNDKYFRNARMSNKTPWLVVASPNQKWADIVYGTASKDNLDKLTHEMRSILRLDNEDPVSAWKKHNELLKSRGEKLNSFRLDYLHFEGPNTDLKIYLNPTSNFEGAASTTDYGLQFFPNMPTEEIFTSPDFRKTTGKVAVCKPVQIYGVTINDIKFEFKDGKVVNFDASYGKDVLAKFLETDEGSRSLGEIALVDINSPIYRSGLLFQNILFDENASSHIAIGRGYPFTLEGGASISSEDKLKEMGCNISQVHVDFMIGTEKTNVTGYKADGTKIAIMNNGLFAI